MKTFSKDFFEISLLNMPWRSSELYNCDDLQKCQEFLKISLIELYTFDVDNKKIFNMKSREICAFGLISNKVIILTSTKYVF